MRTSGWYENHNGITKQSGYWNATCGVDWLTSCGRTTNKSVYDIPPKKRQAIKRVLSAVGTNMLVRVLVCNLLKLAKNLVPLALQPILDNTTTDLIVRTRIQQAFDMVCREVVCNKSVDALKSEVVWNSIIKMVFKTLAQHFTLEQLEDLALFCQTNTGQHVVRVLTSVEQNLIDGVLTKLFLKTMADIAAEIKKQVLDINPI